MEENQKCSYPNCTNDADCTCDNCGKSYCHDHCTHDTEHVGGMICTDCKEKAKSEDEDQGDQPSE